MQRSWNKVFEIGSPKTATSSLGMAYELLGLKQTGYNKELMEKWKEGDFEPIIEEVENFDAFQDGPWHAKDLYKLLDQKFPNSKFILLERDYDSWIKSFEKHFSKDTGLRRIDPKNQIDDFEEKKQKIIDRRKKKYADIQEYFKDRPDDLLIMNIIEGDGWEKLCPFLGFEIPDEPFPHMNKTADKQQESTNS